MIKEVNTVNFNITVNNAAKVMAEDETYQGYVIVLKDGKPIGIVTERDIVNKIIAKDLDPTKVLVSTVMTTPLVTVDPEEDLLRASKLMKENNVRKLIVIRNDIIYGIITAKSIAHRCGEYVDRSIKDIILWTPHLGF
ncbi:MAG: CBS domain-containing protein [Candidatus Bathyarchaeota archaeon]|nr:MAG: CBS domain-containing protein [Candidatus Bathyarchaeota archaeon]